MKRKQLITLALLSCISLTGNAAYTNHLWQDYKATSALCERLDRNQCAMVPEVISKPLDEAPVQSEAHTDPIGNLIQQATSTDLLPPPVL